MGPKQRREREREATRQAMLEAALEIASEEGWQAVTIRRVAERIEYSPSAIYKYFEDKDAIMHELLLQGFQQMLATLEYASTQEYDPAVRLQKMAVAYWDFVWRHPTVYQLMFDLKGSVYEVQEAKDTFLLVRAAIEEWSQACEVIVADLDAAVDILWAMLHGMVALNMSHLIYGGETRAKKLLLQAVDTLLLAWKTPL